MKSVINIGTQTNRPTVAIFTKKRWILLIIGVLILLATAAGRIRSDQRRDDNL